MKELTIKDFEIKKDKNNNCKGCYFETIKNSSDKFCHQDKMIQKLDKKYGDCATLYNQHIYILKK